MFGEFGERVRVLRERIRAPPFQPFRMDVLLILGRIAIPRHGPDHHVRQDMRGRILDVLENIFSIGMNPPEQGPDMTELRRETIGLLRVLMDNPPNNPLVFPVVQLLHWMIVRDERLGLPLADPLLRQFIGILHRVLSADAHLEVGARDRVIASLRFLFNRQLNYAAENVRRQLRDIHSLLDIILNHPVIIDQAQRQVQTQLINHLFHLIMNPQQNQPEHFELFSLMVQLLVAEPNGFNEARQERLQELMQQLHQDAVGHAFIENFENILMEVIAEDDGDAIPELSEESHQTLENIHPVQGNLYQHSTQSSSGQTGERRFREELGDTATSKKQRMSGGKAKPAKKK